MPYRYSCACIGGAGFSLPTTACGRISSHLLTVSARIGAARLLACRSVFFQRSHLFQQFVGPLGLGLIYFADREPDMDQHVIADPGLRHKVQIDLAGDAAELHFGEAVPTAIRRS